MAKKTFGRRVNFILTERDMEWLDTLAYILDTSADEVVRTLIFATYTGHPINVGGDLRKYSWQQIEESAEKMTPIKEKVLTGG